jgi:hypothetical protein
MKTRRFSLFILGAGLLLAPVAARSAYIPFNATYNGLFYETNGLWQQSSGIITITTTSRGKYTARMQIGARRYGFSGQLDPDGRGSMYVPRSYQQPLLVAFQVDTDPDLIYGTISDDTWTAELIADRAVFDGKTRVSPDAGRYTMIIPGDFTSTNIPGGDSYGTITVDKAGRIRFSGYLADRTPLTQSARVSKGGNWPFYAGLYRGQGSLFGWMLLNGSSDEDIEGDVTWIKPERPWDWYYPDGFALSVSAWGSDYVRPSAGQRVLDMTSATVEFVSAEMDEGITNRISLDLNSRVANLGPASMKFSFSLSTGLFSGRLLHPVTWGWIPFRGVVLQRQNVAAGYFPGWSQTGEVWVAPE